uniref:Interferon stimulated exonuclease gene 20 like 2 n=1 Tax=Buteo japonicus TaxID=224669 RepID=A0A8C0C022_9AVES
MYIRPTAPIVDYRTRWSGIRRQHMVNAIPFSKAQREILRILSGKIVVGHAIYNDFKALKYFHPKALTRDTSKIPLLNRKGGFPENTSISLKRLTKELLHKDIQVGKNGHSSVEDARATMELYKVVEFLVCPGEGGLLLTEMFVYKIPIKKKLLTSPSFRWGGGTKRSSRPWGWRSALDTWGVLRPTPAREEGIQAPREIPLHIVV